MDYPESKQALYLAGLNCQYREWGVVIVDISNLDFQHC
jgi:hypothetical protein